MSKLRSYKVIKDEYKLETYLLTDIDKKFVSYFTKLRISNSKLMIEEGRHHNVPIENTEYVHSVKKPILKMNFTLLWNVFNYII